jgi:hypothetical protein
MRKLKRTIFVFPGILFALVLVLALFASPVAADTGDDIPGDPTGDGVFPYFLVSDDKSPNCEEAGYGYGIKVNNSPNGTIYPDGINSITIQNSDNYYFDWESSLGIDAVLVKAGTYTNVFVYDNPSAIPPTPEDTADTLLHAPFKENNTDPVTYSPRQISHIEFCFDYELDVSKTANTTYTREYVWELTKEVTGPFTRLEGDSQEYEFQLTLDRTDESTFEYGFFVHGTITIDNNTPYDATIAGVSDSLGTPDCDVSFPYILVAGGQLVCTYDFDLGSKANGTNHAEVIVTGSVNGGEASADYVFGEPTTLVNAQVNIVDDNTTPGDNTDDHNYGAFGNDQYITYTETWTCGTDEQTHTNSANLYGDNDALLDTATATAKLNCLEISVTKDADTSLTRTYEWDITKTVVPPSWDLFAGESGTSQYTITVNKTGYQDSLWAVAGTITINNPANYAITLDDVSDLITLGDIDGNADCGGVIIVPANGSIVCTYSAELPDAAPRLNTATAAYINVSFDKDGDPTPTGGTTSESGTADVIFDEATDITEVYDQVNVTDDYATPATDDDLPFGPLNDGGSVNYERTFTCNADEGDYHNVATIDETGDSNDADVSVTCYTPTIDKTANGDFDRNWTWSIDKKVWSYNDDMYVDGPLSLEFAASQGNFIATYQVSVEGNSADSNYRIENGTITIHNPHPTRTMDLTAVTDSLDLTVVCPALSVPAGGSLACSYSYGPGSEQPSQNTAAATQQLYDFASDGTATADGTATYDVTVDVEYTINEYDECIDVTDDLSVNGVLVRDGLLVGEVCGNDDGTKTTHTFAPYTYTMALECNTVTRVNNVASYISNNTANSGSDDVNIEITVECPTGCTLTIGYWKTHSDQGPAPINEDKGTWSILGDYDGDGIEGQEAEDLISGLTWYEAFWTAPQGSVWYNLAHQYMGAYLNVANGADDMLVAVALGEAKDWLETNTPGARLKGSDRKEAGDLQALFASYNEGDLGPNHCDANDDFSG